MQKLTGFSIPILKFLYKLLLNISMSAVHEFMYGTHGKCRSMLLGLFNNGNEQILLKTNKHLLLSKRFSTGFES